MELLKSSIFRKMIVGVCGLVWMGFVFGHMAGNFLIFVSAEAYNQYGHAIVSNKILLYGTEGILILAILGHVIFGISLSLENRRANKKMQVTPNKYAVSSSPKKKARFGSTSMAAQGSIILCFIIYHLITFKYGPSGPEYQVVYDGVQMRDLHKLVLEVFQSPAYVLGYIVCLILLGIHLSHGFWSVFQTWGFNHPRYTPVIKKVSALYAIVVAGGFIAQPLYVFLLN